MGAKEKDKTTEENIWESEKLGADEKHVKPVDPLFSAQIDELIGLQMISIRLEKSLIESFKLLSAFHGVGYQPLMRDALKRFAEAEMKAIVLGVVESQRKEQSDKHSASRGIQKAIKQAA